MNRLPEHCDALVVLAGYYFQDPSREGGYALGTDTRYGSGDWATVEPEARKHWESRNSGTWRLLARARTSRPSLRRA